MEALIVNFRRSLKRTYKRQMIIRVPSVNSKDAANKLVGKDISWESPGKKVINGKISSAHGNSGCVRAIFEKGLPGQSIGKKVKIN